MRTSTVGRPGMALMGQASTGVHQGSAGPVIARPSKSAARVSYSAASTGSGFAKRRCIDRAAARSMCAVTALPSSAASKSSAPYADAISGS
jgi:hypothetical protein